MSTLLAPETWGRPLLAARSASPEILSYGLFSALVCSADLWLTFVGPQSMKAPTVAFTGWNPSMPYLFGLYFAFSLVFGRDRRFRLRLGLVAPLLVYLVFGVVQNALPRGEDFGNPYLQVSPWRPLWTVALPALWILALTLPPVFRSRGVRPLLSPPRV